jgi:hypothetical protein
MVVDEWDGWLKWDGTIEVLPSFESRRQSTASSFYGSESSEMNPINNPESIICEDILEPDGLFELDEPSTSFPFPFQSFQHNDDSRSIKLRDQSIENPGRPLHAYSTLSTMEERRLRDIAMPDYIIAAGTANTSEQDSSVPTANKARGRPRGVKRKSSTAKEDQIEMCQYRKQSHNTIEKRYRINLNDKIDLLRHSIPKFHNMQSTLTEGDEGETSHEPGSPSAYKAGKAAVLIGAVEYISQLENSTKRLGAETAALKVRLAAFEKLAVAGSIFSGEGMCPDTPVSEVLEGNQPDPHFVVQVYKLNNSLDFEQVTALKATSIGTDSSHGSRKEQVVVS